MKVEQKFSSVLRLTLIRSLTVVWPLSSSSGGAGIISSIIKSSEDNDCISANKHSKGASSSKSIPYIVIAWEETFNLVGCLLNLFVSALLLE